MADLSVMAGDKSVRLGDPTILAVKRDALARRNECHVRRWLFSERRRSDNECQ